MKKQKLTTKANIVLIMILCFFFLNAQAVIVPSIQVHSQGGSKEGAIALWLTINLFMILYFIARAIIYFIIKNKLEWTKQWYQFIIQDSHSGCLGMKVGLVMLVFLTFNGVIFVLYIASCIRTFLE